MQSFQQTHRAAGWTVTTAMLLAVTGCSLTPLAKQTAAFSAATNLVADHSQDAYRTANNIYFESQLFTAVRAYDTDPTWNPGKIQPLLSRDQIKARTDLLNLLKDYAQHVADIENSPNQKALNGPAAGVGSGASSLVSSIPANLTGGSGITLSTGETNAISTATDALERFLVQRTVKKELLPVLQKMDPQVEAICRILAKDTQTLESNSANNSSNVISAQDMYIRNAGASLSLEDKRTEIRREAVMSQQAQTSKELFDALHLAIVRLALAHHALATAAQGNDPESIKARIADLEASGKELASFYNSLPTS
jgi:hypothetical protein